MFESCSYADIHVHRSVELNYAAKVTRRLRPYDVLIGCGS